jgi:hypothetical protein
LPYAELVIVLQQRIINVLHRTYNITYQDAYNKWFAAVSKEDDTIIKIIELLIHNSCNGEGLPVIINRNPTISYGSILQMFCVGINFNFTMSVPLQVLKPLAADFDGKQNCRLGTKIEISLKRITLRNCWKVVKLYCLYYVKYRREIRKKYIDGI